MASIGEVEAIFITAAIAAALALWGVVTTRVVARRAATMEHFRRIASDKDMIEARSKFIRATQQPGGLASYAGPDALTPAEEIADDADAIRGVLNDFEMMSIGVQFGIFDLEIIRRYWKSTVIRDWTHAAPFIYKLRADLKSPALYHEFEQLARWMQDEAMPKRFSWVRLWF